MLDVDTAIDIVQVLLRCRGFTVSYDLVQDDFCADC